jgi:hypothetical protein
MLAKTHAKHLRQALEKADKHFREIVGRYDLDEHSRITHTLLALRPRVKLGLLSARHLEELLGKEK